MQGRSILRDDRFGATDEEERYPAGWYALALSSEVPASGVMGCAFLGSRVVIRRDAGGQAVVQSGYCPHLGADLSAGEIVDGDLRCPFHHWCFDAKGACTRIPTEGKIPPGARVFTYPTAEAWGLVWAFAGGEPVFGVPRVPKLEERELAYRLEPLGTEAFPAWLPTSNGVDFQHLRSVHGMRIPGPQAIEVREHHIEYTLSFPGSVLHGLITGTNTFSLFRKDGDEVTFRIWPCTPVAPGYSRSYSVVGLLDPRPATEEGKRALEKRLDELEVYMARLRDEDHAILASIRFRQGVLVEADRHLAAFFKYVR
ncbi:MAG: Rieske 2Fe-2S domain-containing protein, partial [Polyangiaceae bacterium]